MDKIHIPKLGLKLQSDKEMIRRFNETIDDRNKAIELYVDISPWDKDIKKLLKKILKNNKI